MNTMDNIGHWQILPTELTIAIIDEIDEQGLLLLATVSRYFHRIAMDAYFSRANFDPHSSNIILGPFLTRCEDSRQIIAGLATYLWDTGCHLDQLSYQPGYVWDWKENPATELLLLTRYLEKLSSIDKLSLHISSHHRGDPEEYRRRIIILLKTALEKSSNSLQIVTRHWASREYEEPECLLPRSLPPNPSDWLQDYWPNGHEPSTFTPTQRRLEKVSFERVNGFLLPFYYHVLKGNALSITSIDFKGILEEEGSDWATMMAELHFPCLTHLSIVHAAIPRTPFVQFLVKHRGIQEFCYCYIQYKPETGRRARLRKDLFERLETVTTTPEEILHFFPPISRMSALKTFVIQIEKGDSSFSALDKALQCLVQCEIKIDLIIQMTDNGLGFGPWLKSIMRKDLGKRPESLLQCVDALSLDKRDWDLDSPLFDILPTWLRLFPALRALTLRGTTSSASNSVAEDTVFDSLIGACPGIHIEWDKESSVIREFF